MTNLSSIQYISDGSNTTFGFQFDVISQSYISVTADGVEVPFTFLNDSTITLDEAAPSGQVIEIKRTTPIEQNLVDFNDGSTLQEGDLDRADRQHLHLIQEMDDEVQNSLRISSTGIYDAGDRRIANVGEPVEEDDAISKGWAEQRFAPTITEDDVNALAAFQNDRRFPSYEDLAADTFMDTSGSAGLVSPGDFIVTSREGGIYEVAPPSETTPDLVTAGGVPLYIRPKNGFLPLEYFGVNENSGDVSAELLNALREAALQGGTVVLPGYDIHLEDKVTLALTGDLLNREVAMVGHGPRISRIIVDGASANGGIDIDSPNSRGASYIFEKFGLIADGTVNGTALKATMLPGGSRQNSSMLIRNVTAIGISTEAAAQNVDDYFDVGFNVTGAWRAYIENARAVGILNTGQEAHGDNSENYLMSTGIICPGTYDMHLHSCHFAGCHTGVSNLEQVGAAPSTLTSEVFRITASQINAVRVGIDHHRPGLEPQFVVSDVYINYRDVGVRVKGVLNGEITGCMFDQKDSLNQFSGVPTDISVEFCEDLHIHRNKGNFNGDTRRRFLTLLDTDPQAGRVTRRIHVERNNLSGNYGTVLLKGADTDSVTYQPGDYSASTLSGPEVSDNSTVPPTMELVRPWCVSLTADGSQSIPDDTETPLVWNTAEKQDFASMWTSGSNITVPSGYGITEARIVANAAFATATLGRREIIAEKNGSKFAGSFHVTAAPVGGANTRLNGASVWVPVSAGDTLRVTALQDRGSPLTVTEASIMVEMR